MAVPHFDVAVVGAGPAGAAAAKLLADWSYRVLLIDRPGGPVRKLAESIPPSAQKLLARLGLLTPVEDMGFRAWRGNTVTWGGRPRRETFAPGVAGYLVKRSEFDATLVRLAVASGATCWTGSVRSIGGVDSDGDLSLVIDPAPGSVTPPGATATFVIDASGRTGVLARPSGRRLADAPRTIALAGLWRSSAHRPFDDLDPSHTVVASYADGWAWSVATADDERQVTVMVDPERTSLEGDGASDIYRREVSKVVAFARPLEDARLMDHPWGADASAYTADRYSGRRFLLVGDAGSFIDPLSSFGVKKALASAWLGAIVTRTILARPEMREHATAFFDAHERQMASTLTAQAARFAAEAMIALPEGDESPDYWEARALQADDEPGEDHEDVAALARDPQVLAAFEALRAAPAAHLTIEPTARIAPRAAVRGHEIVLDEHVFLPAWPHGIRYLRHVDLVALLQLAPLERDVGRLYDMFVREHPGVPLPDFLGALAVLVARGALRLAH